MINIYSNNLYKTIERLCDPTENWKQESISISRLNKYINDNLDQFYTPSEEYGMKRKFESLLNLSERVKKEFRNALGRILAFSIQGIANEVLNEGIHSEPSLPHEIIEHIVYFMLLNNINDLSNIYPKNTDLIWRKFKLNVDSAFLKLLENYNFDLRSFRIKREAAVDFIIDHKNQLSNANLGHSMNIEILKKLATHCPHLQSLQFCIFENIGQGEFSFIGNLTSLKILSIHLDSRYTMPGLSLALEKLTSLTQLTLLPFFEDHLPAIGKMTNLKLLSLDSRNYISGSVTLFL